MTNSSELARSDLAFMRAVVEDRGPLPAIFGIHFLAAGLIFSVDLLLIWAGLSDRIAWLHPFARFLWLPGILLYLPVVVGVGLRARKLDGLGPSARVFAVAWWAMALMTVAVLGLTTVTWIVTKNDAVWSLWPALGFVLYGGTWSIAGFIRGKSWHGAVALGCFLTAIASGAMAGGPEAWLVLAVGMVLFMSAPGWAILHQATR